MSTVSSPSNQLTPGNDPTPGNDLTPCQLAAVDHFEGPLLVLAGPGSGKTRVITRRIARLVQRRVPPWSILAITFTNKAAREMTERVERLLPGNRVWVSTFHRFCSKLLRQHGAGVGLQPNFSILDETDRRQLLREVISELDLDPNTFSPGRLGGEISSAKNQMRTPEVMKRGLESRYRRAFDDVLVRVYERYQKRLLEGNGVDFDDLLLHVSTLLSENDELRRSLDARFRFILVDEYQDTNLVQYRIVRSLSCDHPNLCATGDPDQSIYGWRGAEIANILRFESDYPNAKIVRLEQNYRSTKSILAAADRLIAHNTQRKEKSLRTDNPHGVQPVVLTFMDQRHEADGVAMTIRHLARDESRPWSEFAIFYRVNSLSRELEMALSRQGVPYQVAAGLAFYERAEIKDLIAYLRLVNNPLDRTAFLRVVNTPARGIGKTSLRRLVEWADREGIGLLDAARRAKEIPGVGNKPAFGLTRFAELIDDFMRHGDGGVYACLQRVIDRSHVTSEYSSHSDADAQRQANVGELLNAARQYDQQNPDDPTLSGFLEGVSLASDVDAVDESAGKVTLMTLHAAKGLEFPVVFLVGVEHGLLPHQRSVDSHDPMQIEEERRLMFVGVTRAMHRLYATQTLARDTRGRRMQTIPSQFVSEAGFGFDHDAPFSPPSECDDSHPDLHPDEHPDENSILHPDENPDEHRLGDEGPPASEADVAFPPLLDEAGPAVKDPATRPPSASVRMDRETASSATPSATPSATTSATPSATTASSAKTASKAASAEPVASRPSGIKLTTGAALLNGTKTPASIPSAFEVGTTVLHPQYGTGEVLATDGSGRKRRVTVRFESGRDVTFIAHLSPLQPASGT